MKENKVPKSVKYMLFILFLLLPVAVFADMGAPSIKYQVRVSNINGARTDDEELKVIPYDTVLTVVAEWYEDDGIYIEC